MSLETDSYGDFHIEVSSDSKRYVRVSGTTFESGAQYINIKLFKPNQDGVMWYTRGICLTLDEFKALMNQGQVVISTLTPEHYSKPKKQKTSKKLEN